MFMVRAAEVVSSSVSQFKESGLCCHIKVNGPVPVMEEESMTEDPIQVLGVVVFKATAGLLTTVMGRLALL